MSNGFSLHPPLRGLSLCAGYGGFDLALHLAFPGRLRTVCYVEREADAAAVLVARMGSAALDHAPIWDDLTTLDGAALRRAVGAIDWIAGGIPCQDHSTAGSRKGAEGERNLWPDFARLLVQTGARFAFLENVPGLLSSPGRSAVPVLDRYGLERADAEPVRGGSFGGVLADLAALGFDAEWCVLGAKDVGAPHRRDRVWLFAWRRDVGPRGVSNAFGDALRFEPERGAGRAQTADERNAEPGELGADVADSAHDHRRGRECGTKTGSRENGIGGRRFASGGAGVDHAERRRLARSGQPERSGQQGARRGDPVRSSDDGFELWPPGPGDREAWARVPAEAQPAIRRVADGPTAGVERAARLRALGNGIVPLVGAAAFRTLVARAQIAP